MFAADSYLGPIVIQLIRLIVSWKKFFPTKSQGEPMGTRQDLDPNAEVLDGEWEGFKATWVGCDTESCETWTCIRVKIEFNVSKEPFMCGVCAAKEVKKLKGENTDLRSSQKKEADERKEKAREESELLGDWTNVVKRIKKDKVFEKLENVVTKETVKETVKESTDKELRDRRMIVFNLEKDGIKSDKDQMKEIFEVLNVGHRIREEDVVDIRRMREIDNVESGKARPLIVEFRTSYEKWIVLGRKVDLKNHDQYKKVFLDMDRNREERIEDKRRRKLVWDERLRQRKAEKETAQVEEGEVGKAK